jgi:amino acid adenylation domain-containing protein
MLGVWKAGAAYVPLDPAYPAERLRFMAADAGLAAVLTEDGLAGESPASGVPVIALDREWERIQQFRADAAALSMPDKALAYIMYTSGSTGVPKGAMVERGGMRNHLWAKIRDFNMTAGDVVAQNAPSSFDVSVWQFLAALMVGARVQIISEETARDASALLGEVDRLQITILETVPTLFGLMIEEQRQKGERRLRLDKLRWLICNAEPLPGARLIEWFQLYPAVRVVNAYGPTECSDDVTHFFIDAVSAENWRITPLGKPIQNMEAYVLDSWLRPVPTGVSGELYLGGTGVGRGYHERPEVTAERYLPNPFSDVAGARLYRTGDLVRRSWNGDLHFLGRVDHQVKLRGNRIELSEIEATLNLHQDVLRSAVLIREDQSNEPNLVAYVVLRGGSKETSDLRQFLRQRLPQYMLPAIIVPLDAMPLSANEKIDRAALPKPDLALAGYTRKFVAPRSAIEQMLVSIWSEVFGNSGIGIEDNLFELGGHSLLATRILARINGRLNVHVPLRAIFDHPTVASLAEFVNGLEPQAAAAPTQSFAQLVPLTAAAETAVSQIDGLSEDEVDRLLSRSSAGSTTSVSPSN